MSEGQLVANAENQGIGVDSRVRVSDAYREVGFRGRRGTVVRVPRLFQDYVYVRLDMRKRERKQKTELLPVDHLELDASPAPAQQRQLPLERSQ